MIPRTQIERAVEGNGHCGHDLDGELGPEDSLTCVHMTGQKPRSVRKTTIHVTTPRGRRHHHLHQLPTPSLPSPGVAITPSLYSSSPPRQPQPQIQPQPRTGAVVDGSHHAGGSYYSASTIMQQRRGNQGPFGGLGPGGYGASSLPPPQRPSPPVSAAPIRHGRRNRQQPLGAAVADADVDADLAPSSSSPLARYSHRHGQVHGQDPNSHVPPTPSPSSSRTVKRQNHRGLGHDHNSRGALGQNTSVQTWEAAPPTRGNGGQELGSGRKAPFFYNDRVVSSRSFFSEAPPRPIPFVPGRAEREWEEEEEEEEDQGAKARRLLVTARNIIEEAGALAVQIRGQGLGRRTAFVDGTRDRARVLRKQLKDVQAGLRLLDGMADCDVAYDDLFDSWFVVQAINNPLEG